jgi:hypothetical protein
MKFIKMLIVILRKIGFIGSLPSKRNPIANHSFWSCDLQVCKWCYDHNFLRFSTIFVEKIGVFLKNQCYDQIFEQFSFVFSQKWQLFRWFFCENIKKIITSVPRRWLAKRHTPRFKLSYVIIRAIDSKCLFNAASTLPLFYSVYFRQFDMCAFTVECAKHF